MFTRDFRIRLVLSILAIYLLVAATFFMLSAIKEKGREAKFQDRFEVVLKLAENYAIDERPTVVAFGASDIALNFSPREISSFLNSPEGIDIENFGVILGGPDHTEQIVRRFARSVSQQKKKIDLAIVGFRAMMFTSDYERFSNGSAKGFHMFYEPEFDLRKLLRNPVKLSDIYMAKNLNVFAPRISAADIFRDILNSDFFYKNKGLDYRNKTAFFWREISDGSKMPAWDARTSGEIDVFNPEYGAFFTSFIEKNRNDLYLGCFENHSYMYGHLNMYFSGEMFKIFNQSIEELKAVSNNILVVYYPDFLRKDYPQLSQDARIRLDAALSNFQSRKDIQFLNLQDSIGLNDEDVFDLVHMNPSGKKKFNGLIAKKMKSILENARE